MAVHPHAHWQCSDVSVNLKKKCAGSKNNGVYGRSWTEGVGTGFEPMEFLNPILDL